MTRIRSYRDLEELGAIEYARLIDRKIQALRKESKQTADSDMRKQHEHRINYAATLKQKALGLPYARSLFISYSRTGDTMRTLVDSFFRREKGYELIDWTSDEESRIPDNILNGIAKARFFLGIWSRHYDVVEVGGRELQGNKGVAGEGWVPSPWMYFELGAAMALGKTHYIFWLPDADGAPPHVDVFKKILPEYQRLDITVRNHRERLAKAHEYFESVADRDRPYARE